MNNYSSLVICQVQPFRASGPGLKRPLERLNKPVQMPAIHHPHACGGNARCTTCRVHFVAGEPERMTEAEKQVLAARGILGNAGVRLSCQILCDHEMTVYAIRRFAGSGRANVGNRPAEQITPPPTWINT